ncbi:MAG: DUF2922 domain-containing protein [Negativicutes bacterium]|jgi:hypothetical protein
MSKQLNMNFKDAAGADYKIGISQPKEGLDAATIRTNAQAIVTANIFANNGSNLASYAGAQLVETTKTDFAS